MSHVPGNHSMSPERFNEAAEPPKAGHGCFFYGCITAIVLAVLLMAGIAISGYFGYQAYLKIVKQYTSPTPTPLPKVEMSKENREALRGRIDAFKHALEQGEDTEPLVLSGDELNVMLADKPDLADRVYFVLEGDKLKGQVSLPLGELALPGLKGRYLNGKAEFVASLQNGQLNVRADSIEVNGQPLSQQIMTGLGNTNLAEDVAKKPENATLLNRLESLQIKDGKLTIKAKPAKERSLETKKQEEPGDVPTTKPDDMPATKPGDVPQPLDTTRDNKPIGENPVEKPSPEPVEKLEKPAAKTVNP
ncbi:hypothetical protein SAMN05444166_0987 [Singulisphaera sp. GP187]|uniref:hypothetical protein n=1 Tax=Singulisphaera sp. GP187 TaxID=1882752 RepID=UPI00092BCAB2|nr:hypothetical protein [Singulisphaera sp. GP187]SIN80717.1 hypothetical protein SAMN05444166_0987 [Singulisphaera sp. GP187]